MPRTRTQNVTAAQWSPNGGALGAPDLTVPANQIFGANVFSPSVQRQRVPSEIFKRLQETLEQGLPLETAFAAYTSGSSWINGRDRLDGAGVLEPGNAADLVVLDRDPFAHPADEIAAARVRTTYVGGEVVYTNGDGNG